MNNKAMEIANGTLAHTYSDEMPEGAINNFAERIILECCKVIQNRLCPNNPFDSLPVMDIRDHFGLEPNRQCWVTRNLMTQKMSKSFLTKDK